MKLTVKNFGPIREAKNVEISPMTIFVGPSNTGKSYLAMLIYSIVKIFADEEYAWDISRQIRRDVKSFSEIYINLRKSQNSAVLEIEGCFYQWANAVSNVWKHLVVYCFGEEGRNVIEGKDGYENFSVTISEPENQLVVDLTTPANSKITLQKKKQIYKYTYHLLVNEINQYIGDNTLSESDEIYEDVMRRYYPEVIFQQFQAALLPGAQHESFIEANYLPAVRGGIMQSHRTLVSALIERAPMAGLSDSPQISLFNGVLSDFMKKLINIGSGSNRIMRPRRRLGMRRWHYNRPDDARKRQKKVERIGRNIERQILSGEIYIRRSEAQYPDFRYRFTKDDKEYDLPLMSASSSVSELAPVSLFIRYHLLPDDLFIVEEPEAHLHPAAQRDISDFFVQLVNSGVNTLVTTHSDNILEQISNFIYASDLPDSNLTKLDEEQCSIYLFKHGRGGKKTTVKKVPFDSETGLLTEDHLNVSSALYNETVELMEQRDNVGSQTDIS